MADGAYTLTVRAADGAGNATVVQRSVRVANGPAEAVVGLGAVAGSGGVALSWLQPAASDAAVFRITRDGQLLAELPADRRAFLDTAAAPGSHTYGVVVVDRYGRVGAGGRRRDCRWRPDWALPSRP